MLRRAGDLTIVNSGKVDAYGIQEVWMGMLRALINLVLLCAPAAIAALVSARLSRTSKEEWALLAWVPPLPLLGFGLYVGMVQARDPTAANLWPFVMVFLIGITAILFALFLIARRFLDSDRATGPRWKRRDLSSRRDR